MKKVSLENRGDGMRLPFENEYGTCDVIGLLTMQPVSTRNMTPTLQTTRCLGYNMTIPKSEPDHQML